MARKKAKKRGNPLRQGTKKGPDQKPARKPMPHYGTKKARPKHSKEPKTASDYGKIKRPDNNSTRAGERVYD
jgi:hypothetical protein